MGKDTREDGGPSGKDGEASKEQPGMCSDRAAEPRSLQDGSYCLFGFAGHDSSANYWLNEMIIDGIAQETRLCFCCCV